MAKNRTYTVRYERDEDGFWVADVPSLQGCHAQGRSIASVKRAIREVIDLIEGDGTASKSDFVESFDLPSNAARSLAAMLKRQVEHERAKNTFTTQRAKVVQRLNKDNYSRRDIGEIVGISYQRVQQLIGDK